MIKYNWCGWIKVGFGGKWVCVCRHKEWDMCWTMLRTDEDEAVVQLNGKTPWHSMVVLPKNQVPVARDSFV